jgi:tetratricopeptide (TPR) repeat protein
MTDTPVLRSHRSLVRVLLGVLLLALAIPGWAQESKTRSYTLAQPPLEIRDRLADLDLGPVPRLRAGERSFLSEVWERKAKAPTTTVRPEEGQLLEATLYASGVEDATQRHQYRKQYQTLLAGARKAVKGAKSSRERGEKLMKYLHADVMHNGYESGQCSLAVLFDSGKFNCVSSAALYYLVGTELGMDLRVISIPAKGSATGHVSLDLVLAGKRIQVEPTSPNGFDYDRKLHRPGVTTTDPLPDRKEGHEVDGPGIVALIYYNRGCALGRAKPARPLDTIRSYLGALALDPVDELATQNLVASFVNWGVALLDEKKFEEAIRVFAFGLSIAPKSELMRKDLRAAWVQYIEATLQGGDDKAALAVIARAVAAAPEGDFPSAAIWFIRQGERRLKDGDWEAGLAVAERGLRALPEAEAKQLREWRGHLFRRWSEWHLDEKQGPDIEGSVKALARGYALDENDPLVIAGLAYHTQEALKILERKEGRKAAIDHYQALRKQFPRVDRIAATAATFAWKAAQRRLDDKKFEEAVAAADEYQVLLSRPEQRADLTGVAYAGWARSLAADKQWKAALDKCREGLKAAPKQTRLIQAARAIVDEWAGPEIDAGHWDEAIGIYAVGLDYLPGDTHLQEKKETCAKRKG